MLFSAILLLSVSAEAFSTTNGDAAAAGMNQALCSQNQALAKKAESMDETGMTFALLAKNTTDKKVADMAKMLAAELAQDCKATDLHVSHPEAKCTCSYWSVAACSVEVAGCVAECAAVLPCAACVAALTHECCLCAVNGAKDIGVDINCDVCP